MTISSIADIVAIDTIHACGDLIVESWRMGVGIVSLEPGIGPSAIAVSAGIVSLLGSDNVISLGTGEAAAIPAGTQCAIEGERAFAYRISSLRRGTWAGSAPLRINCSVPRHSTPLPPAEVMLSPMPTCAGAVLFEDEAAGFKIGVWSSTPYARKVLPHRVHEFMLLRTGAVQIMDRVGGARGIAAPQGYFIAKGEPAGWSSEEDVEKIYIVQG